MDLLVPQTPVRSCFLIVQGNLPRAVRIMSDMRTACPMATLRHASDLSEARDLSEKAHPDLVILDKDVLQEEGIAVFISLLSALAVDWVVVYFDTTTDRLPERRQIRFDALQSFVTSDWRSRAATTDVPDWQDDTRPPVPQAEGNRTEWQQGTKKTDRASDAPTGQHWKPVVIGASTGGIDALIEVLSRFPAHGPPTLVVQHIKGSFVPGLAERLDRICAPSVRAAEGNELLAPGHILLAPGNSRHLEISQDGRRCRLENGPPENGHRPSVDRLFASAARALGPNAVGIILSGMGRDGASGLLAMRDCGAWTIGQDQVTSTVYGMPRAAAEMGALREELPLSRIGSAALKAASLPHGTDTPQSMAHPGIHAPTQKKTHDA